MPIGFKFLSSDILVNTHTGNNQTDAVITKLDGGGFLVVWASKK